MANLDINNTFKRRSSTYRLVVTNDDTYDEVIAFRLSRKSVYLGFSIAFMFLVGLTIALIAFTPLKYYIPGYGTKESRSALELLKISKYTRDPSLSYKGKISNNNNGDNKDFILRDPNDSFDNIVVELYFKSEETKSSVSRFTRTTSDDTKLKCSFKLANNLLQDAYKKYITVSNNFTKKENFI